MTVVVSYITPARVGGEDQGIGNITRQERITVPGTTSQPTKTGEVVIIANGESGLVAAAWGSAPDADATDASATTTAGCPIAAGQMGIPFAPGGGKLINIKAVP